MDDKILIGKNKDGKEVFILLNMANRHGIIAGATGTGKTVTLQLLAEEFSKQGVNVFAVDVKGDLSGISQKGTRNSKIEERLKLLNIKDFTPESNPTIFWDIFGNKGHQLSATVDRVGPLIMSRILDLTDVQSQVLEMLFHIARNKNLPLIDLKDLQSFLKWIGENTEEIKKDYGYIAPQTLGGIQRKIINLHEAGGDKFFSEPAFDIQKLFVKDFNGHGTINIIDASSMMNDKRLYSSFLLWILSELFEKLEEVGDINKPKLVFFFDEAHLLFEDVSNALFEKINQVVKLIRSKGVGVFFITQNPTDIPDSVLAQLGNRIQHALRAYTPDEQKSIKVAVNSFRQNPNMQDLEKELTSLAVGEALASTLDEKGVPSIVEHVIIASPTSKIGAISDEERKQIILNSPYYELYKNRENKESATEILEKINQREMVQKENKNLKKVSKSKEKSSSQQFLTKVIFPVAKNVINTLVKSFLKGSNKRR